MTHISEFLDWLVSIGKSVETGSKKITLVGSRGLNGGGDEGPKHCENRELKGVTGFRQGWPGTVKKMGHLRVLMKIKDV